MPFYPVLMLRFNFEIVDMGDEKVAVGVGDNSFHGVVNLKNDEAVFMFKKLQEGITLPDLIFACMNEYKSSVEDTGPKVLEFLDYLRDNKLICADTTRGVNDTAARKDTAAGK